MNSASGEKSGELRPRLANGVAKLGCFALLVLVGGMATLSKDVAGFQASEAGAIHPLEGRSQ